MDRSNPEAGPALASTAKSRINPDLCFSLSFGGMMDHCIFCKIIAGQLPSTQLYKDERVTVFRDAHPVAPTHILIVPNRHITSVNDANPEDEALLGYLFTVARQLARQQGIADSGYRLIVNTGANGGQTIFHLHMHLIGGQRMRHPMG